MTLLRIMRIKILIFFGIISQSMFSYANFTEYFPLKVGNVWSYNWMSISGSGRINVSITRDTIFNSKKYFLCNFPNLPHWMRIDSITGNIYWYSSGGGCSYQPNENLLDSLASKKFDSTNYCGFVKRKCSDTGNVLLFGNTYAKKEFNPIIILTASSRNYAKNIGLYYLNEGDPFTTTYSLRGCVINGVVYGDTTLTSVNQTNSSEPQNFSLSQNYPNPFNPNTIINYSIPSKVKRQMSPKGQANVKLMIYNALGKVIATLVNEKQNSGSFEVEFNGKDLPSGIYFYKLEAGDFVETKKMILLK